MYMTKKIYHRYICDLLPSYLIAINILYTTYGVCLSNQNMFSKNYNFATEESHRRRLITINNTILSIHGFMLDICMERSVLFWWNLGIQVLLIIIQRKWYSFVTTRKKNSDMIFICHKLASPFSLYSTSSWNVYCVQLRNTVYLPLLVHPTKMTIVHIKYWCPHKFITYIQDFSK